MTERIAGGFPAAISAMRTAAGRAASRRSPRAAALVATAGLLVAVLVPAAASAAAPRPATPAASPVPVLHWRSCDGGFQCATALVPLDYRDPRGATISIAMVRHLATDPAHRLGSLFFNSGGPNEQIESFVAGFGEFPAAIVARYDIITFDPRGFGYSTAVRCFPTTAAENQFLAGLPPFPVGARQDATWEQTWARFDAQCAKSNASLLEHDTTADVARDMNLLREAVGVPVLNYIGLSYGTGLGATYANLFPATTGHMILDGNLNQAKWNTLLRRARAHPVTIGSPPQTYTYADVVASVPLGTVSQWQSGASLMQQLWTASTAGGPSAAASPAARTRATLPFPAIAAPPPVYTGEEQQLAVLCADSPNPRDPRAYPAAAQLAAARSGVFGLEYTWDKEACAGWPAVTAEDRYTGPWNRTTANTILVLGNTGDPTLPYQDSVAMSRDLARARLLTVDGYGHTEAGNPSTCATNDEIRYLLTGALPPPKADRPPRTTPRPGAQRRAEVRPPHFQPHSGASAFRYLPDASQVRRSQRQSIRREAE